ncbi:MAG: 50S ribosomal protein L9 [Bdellovibrionales bacterium]|nr:50S ribosomal protein L9 [Bdellovibrionales bacterium]
MEVLLSEDVVGVGDIGDVVKVKGGYARNFLIPRGLAIETGAASAKEIAHRKRQIDAKKRRLKSAAEARADDLRNLSLEFELRVGGGGKAYGSIGSRDVAAALSSHGFELDRRRVLLSEPIKRAGTHFVAVKLHPEVQVQVKLLITAVEAAKKDEQEAAEALREALDEASDAHREEDEGAEEGDSFDEPSSDEAE